MGRGQAWTAEQVEELRVELARGKSAFAISRSQSWPYPTVKKAVHNLGLGIPIRMSGRQREISQDQLQEVQVALKDKPKQSLKSSHMAWASSTRR